MGSEMCIRDRSEPALYQLNYVPDGFEWIDYGDHEKSILIMMRKTLNANETLVMVINNTPSSHGAYRIGVPLKGTWRSIMNTDDKIYAGSGYSEILECQAIEEIYHNRPYSIQIEIPPLSVRYFKLKE